ncbi:hypothetical protein BDZ91DRAFT_845532 [Kalaharituber pfeilii]|nr:hypothetical protein BDZ91DRAFT_845532 [Kalaharituber pfeilii]
MPRRRFPDRKTRRTAGPAPPTPSMFLRSPELYDTRTPYSTLLKLTTTNAALIASRWRKKSIARRTNCLKSAWAAAVDAAAPAPEGRSVQFLFQDPLAMPKAEIAPHAPKLSDEVFTAALDMPNGQSPIAKLSIADYLYSTVVNLAGLTQSPAALLTFLHTRASRTPADLARNDYLSVIMPVLQLFRKDDQVPDKSTIDVTIIGKGEDEYGKIKSWSTKSIDTMTGIVGRNVEVVEPAGECLFRWQKIILDFCVQCVLEILVDIPASKREVDPEFNPETADKAELELLIQGVEPLIQPASTSVLRTRPAQIKLYTPPQPFDFQHAYNLAVTMLREAQDRVTLMRTDASYLLNETSLFLEFRAEHIRDVSGKTGNAHSPEAVAGALKKLIYNSYVEVVMWNEIVLLFEDAEQIIMSTSGTPNEALDEMIFAIKTLLDRVERFIRESLNVHAMAGPQLREYFIRDTTRMLSLSTTSPATVFTDDPIAGLVMCAVRASSQRICEDFEKAFTLRRISAEVERILFEKPDLNDTVHPWIMNQFGAAASIHEIQDALLPYAPSTVTALGSTGPHASTTISTVHAFMEIMPKVDLRKYLETANDADGWTALQRIETVEGALEFMWNSVDKEVQARTKDGRSLEDIMRSSNGRLAKRRKGKWNWQGQVWFAPGAEQDDTLAAEQELGELPDLIPVEPYDDSLGYGNDPYLVIDRPQAPIRTETTQPAPRPRKLPVLPKFELSRPFGTNAEGSTGAVPEPPAPPKEKIKTTGPVALEPVTTTANNIPLPAPPPRPSCVFVPPRVHKHLMQLATGSAPLAWKDFVHMMKKLGFTVSPTGGSMFRFDPEDKENNESIVLHRPHPESELPKVHCKQVWWRLRESYGWDMEMFQVGKGKGVGEEAVGDGDGEKEEEELKARLEGQGTAVERVVEGKGKALETVVAVGL